MELQIDKLTEIIETYDIPSVADKAQKANENFNLFNNNCKEYITRLNKAMQLLDKSITNNENIAICRSAQIPNRSLRKEKKKLKKLMFCDPRSYYYLHLYTV